MYKDWAYAANSSSYLDSDLHRKISIGMDDFRRCLCCKVFSELQKSNGFKNQREIVKEQKAELKAVKEAKLLRTL